MRIGHGYDIHRLVPGAGIVVGGVPIACEFAVEAHSDGDVAIHALCDALLGAAGLGDIGQHFPDTDPQWAGADSRRFLQHVRTLLAGQDLRPGNADLTVIAQAPRLAPHIAAIRQVLADDLGLPEARVNVKATTMERLGPIGRGEGIAAHAVVLLEEASGA